MSFVFRSSLKMIFNNIVNENGLEAHLSMLRYILEQSVKHDLPLSMSQYNALINILQQSSDFFQSKRVKTLLWDDFFAITFALQEIRIVKNGISMRRLLSNHELDLTKLRQQTVLALTAGVEPRSLKLVNFFAILFFVFGRRTW